MKTSSTTINGHFNSAEIGVGQGVQLTGQNSSVVAPALRRRASLSSKHSREPHAERRGVTEVAWSEPLENTGAHSGDTEPPIGLATRSRTVETMPLTCINDGGRGGFRTPDRWCVKPELYH